MKIKQEEFDKLPQLDRIEYRQIEDKINENFECDLFGYILIATFIILNVLAALGAAVIFPFSEETSRQLLNVSFLGFHWYCSYPNAASSAGYCLQQLA